MLHKASQFRKTSYRTSIPKIWVLSRNTRTHTNNRKIYFIFSSYFLNFAVTQNREDTQKQSLRVNMIMQS
jgi:hypothetical protein